MEILINNCYGGFKLSKEALTEYANLKNHTLLECIKQHWVVVITYGGHVISNDTLRVDIDMINIVKKLGNRANNRYSDIIIETIPDDTRYVIEDHDGMETIKLF